MALLSPNSAVAIASPLKENTSTGFLPNRSAARPHEIISSIWVKENKDSYERVDQFFIGSTSVHLIRLTISPL